MGVASICAPPVDDDVRARLTLVVERAQARAAERDSNREAAWGETTAGSAFGFYEAASRLLPAITKGEWNAETEQWIENGALTAERFATLRQQWAPVLELWTGGAHCRDARASGKGVDLHGLARVVTAEFTCGLREGRTTASVRLWLDGFTFSFDMHIPWMMVPAWTDERLRALPAADLDLLDGGLVRLDRRLAQVPDPDGSLANYMTELLDGQWSRDGFPAGQRFAAWRQGFDAERWHLEAIDELVQIAAVLKAPAADGAGRQEQVRAYRLAPRLRATPWSEAADRGLQGGERQQRQELTKLRLLRLAVAFHRRAPLPNLADPFAAGALEVRLDGDTAVFRGAESFPGRERFATRR